MPRIARVVGVGLPHHITQRGNYRQDIFEDDKDRQKYLRLLKSEAERYRLQILAYCLMSNHVHFIGVPKKDRSMAEVFKYVNMQYSQYFNKKKGQGGHLFQGRFFSSILDEYYLMVCARYIERNPVRARIVKNAWDWKWSSARAHCGIDPSDGFGVDNLFSYIEIEKSQWKEFLSQEDNHQDIHTIKKETMKGRPIAGEGFIRNLEEKFKRILVTKPKGRPKKVQSEVKQTDNSVSVPI